MYYVNEDIKNCVRVFPEQGRYDYARYDMNENPEGLPQWFVDEVLKDGARRASSIAKDTLKRVKKAIGLYHLD